LRLCSIEKKKQWCGLLVAASWWIFEAAGSCCFAKPLSSCLKRKGDVENHATSPSRPPLPYIKQDHRGFTQFLAMIALKAVMAKCKSGTSMAHSVKSAQQTSRQLA
jgi:hypothetical protein